MQRAERVLIWDIWVRLFHWSLAVSVVFMLISGSTGWMFFDWHRTIGEAVMVLVGFRLLWGVFGSSNARLWQLVRSPRAALDHFRDLFKRRLRSERGHNAAGSWAVLVMLAMITVQAATGFFIADEDELIEGALYGNLSSTTSDLLYRIHHTNAELLQIVVIVHVIMVFAYLLLGRQNLITPMIHGTMKWLSDSPAPHVFFQSRWVGAVVLAFCILVVGYVADWYG